MGIPSKTTVLLTAATSAVIAISSDVVLGRLLGLDGKLFVGLLYLACLLALSPSDHCEDWDAYALVLATVWISYVGLLYNGLVPIFDRMLAMLCAMLTWWGHEYLFRD